MTFGEPARVQHYLGEDFLSNALYYHTDAIIEYYFNFY
jgi:hypothetical protein